MLSHYRKIGRDGTAMVDCECHLLVMGFKELKTILKNFEEIEAQMKQTARKRRVHHERAIEKVIISSQ